MADSQLSGSHAGPHRVLVVEDNQDMAFVIQRNLESEGFAVRVVRDGAAGIGAGLENWAHAIVLDLMLPEQSGFTVLHREACAGR